MSLQGRALWGLAGLALVLLIALAVISDGLRVMVAGQPLGIFDVQLTGYGVPEARLYLGALSAAQEATYLGLYRVLDTLLPLALAGALLGALWVNRAGAGRWLLWAGIACGLGYLVSDLAENAAVAGVIRAGSEATEAAIVQASRFTVAKWLTLAGAGIALLWLWRRVRRQGGRA